MKESFKKHIDRIEETTMPAKRMCIHCYSDEELEEIIADGEAEEGVTSPDNPLVIIRNALNRSQ
jgi:hypothetical protein